MRSVYAAVEPAAVMERSVGGAVDTTKLSFPLVSSYVTVMLVSVRHAVFTPGPGLARSPPQDPAPSVPDPSLVPEVPLHCFTPNFFPMGAVTRTGERAGRASPHATPDDTHPVSPRRTPASWRRDVITAAPRRWLI
jgi:hypothetical protein